jgi:alpha-tubulin suppressor-like RCC1 family protein
MKRSASFLSVLCVLGAACSSDPSGTGTAATRLVFQVAPAPSARAGVALDPVPVVRLADNAGNSIAQRGVLVTASLVEGPGSVGGTASVRTADDGTASFPGLTIIAGIGVKTLRFSATGLGAARSDPIDLQAGPPASAISLEGNNQSATAGTALLVAPAVKVLDAGGNPVPGVAVRFEIATGGGTVTGGFATTGADGIARVGSWTLGPAGVHSLTAIVEGLESQPVTFSATAVAPVPVAFVTGNKQAGFPGDTLTQEILFRLVTAAGVARAGITVTFSAPPGNGTFTESSVVTDPDGYGRTRWILGTAVGTQTATASAEGQGDGILTASAVLFVAIRAGGSGGSQGGASVCGLTTTGTVYCWGSNFLTQLGDGTSISSRPRPGLVVGGHIFEKLEGAGGGNFYCGIEAGGAGWCWGSGRHGQLGDGTTPTGGFSSRSSPIAVAGGISWSQIDPGGDHACGLDQSGKAYCWGEGLSGQLGDGLGVAQVTPVATSGGLTLASLATGVSHSCGVTFFGDAYCWGVHTGFRAGTGPLVLAPVLIPGGIKFAALAAGRSTCGLTLPGVAYCWGSNSSGQLGNGTTTSTSNPTLVSGGRVFVSLTLQAETTCGLTSDGTAYCWGNNSLGQAGVGHTGPVRVPTAVQGGLRFTQITAGSEVTCGLVDPGISWCWGPNNDGQVGDGSLTPALVPTRTRF